MEKGPFIETRAPHGLYARILARIASARVRSARIRAGFLAVLSAVCAISYIPIIQYATKEFHDSGFAEYASLFFDSVGKGYWKEILYSLAESLPSLAVLLMLAVGIALVWSLYRTASNVRVGFYRTS